MSTEPACYCCTPGNDRGQLRANYARKIDEYGWAVVGVIEHTPTWSYTLGLSLHGHPELVPIDAVVDLSTAELADAEARAGFVVAPVEYSWLRSSVFGYAQEYWLTHRAPEPYQIVISDPADKLHREPGYAGPNQGRLWASRPPGISGIS